MQKYTAQQRAALAIVILKDGRGRRVPTAKIAKVVGVKHRAALAMLRNIEKVVPIALDYDGWRWVGDRG